MKCPIMMKVALSTKLLARAAGKSGRNAKRALNATNLAKSQGEYSKAMALYFKNDKRKWSLLSGARRNAGISSYDNAMLNRKRIHQIMSIK